MCRKYRIDDQMIASTIVTNHLLFVLYIVLTFRLLGEAERLMTNKYNSNGGIILNIST